MAAHSKSPPRDAASLVIVDTAQGSPRLLLGKRRQTQTFAPGKFVFPGGSLDAADIAFVSGERLPETERVALSFELGIGSTHITPEAFALAAIRETFEESGILFGLEGFRPASNPPAAWLPFLAHGVVPNLSALSFIARAVTPSGRPRRFDARFFLADAAAITHRLSDTDGEFEALVWVDFAAARRLDLHGMTREIVEETQRFLALSAGERSRAPVPYYSQGASGWQRRHIERGRIIPGS